MRWTLISGAVVAMAAGVAIPATRPSQDEMLDKLLKIEDQRLVGDADLDVALNSVDPVIAKQALRVVARFGERRYSDAVRHALQSKDGVVRAEAAFAAGMLRDAGLLGDLNTALAMEDRQAAKRELFVAIGRVGNRDALTALEMAWGKAAETEVKAALARAFGYVFTKAESVDWPVTKESLLALWSAAQSTDIDLARSAGFALSRYRPLGQMTEEEVQAQLNSIKAQEAKSFASRFLGKYATTTNAKWIAKQISNPNEADSVRVELVRTLGRLPINVGRDEGLCLAVDRSPFVAVAALEVIETTANEAMVRCGRAIMALAQRSLSPWIKGQALGALIAVDKAQQYSWFEAGIASRDVMLEKAVYARAGKINDSRIRTIALKALLEKDRQVVVPLLESLQEFPAEWLTVDYKNAVLKLLAKKDFVITSDAYDLAAKFKWQEFVGPAQDTLQETWHEDQYDAILGALRLLAQLGGMQHLSVIEPYLEHPNRFVIEQAVATYKAISGTAPRDVPLNHPKVAAETPSYAETVAAAKKHIVIETNLGAIELEAYGEAPLTYANFVRLAEKGFFNGLNFHRVVSHFVAQGGDPRGDGWGGAGYLIRDEVSPVSHLRGTIGLATAGKDTGSCQLFFNLDPNMNLDANYTLFARVVSGLEIMDRVEVGTKIIRTYTRS